MPKSSSSDEESSSHSSSSSSEKQEMSSAHEEDPASGSSSSAESSSAGESHSHSETSEEEKAPKKQASSAATKDKKQGKKPAKSSSPKPKKDPKKQPKKQPAKPTGKKKQPAAAKAKVKGEKKQPTCTPTPSPSPLSVILLLLQGAVIALFWFGEYADSNDNFQGGLQAAAFMDVQVMIYIGFGFLMVFLHRYSYSSIGLTFLLAAVAAETFLITSAIIHTIVKDKYDGLVIASLDSLMRGAFAGGAVLITFGFVLGTFSPLQMIATAICEVILYTINEEIGIALGAADAGGSMTIHMFGAYFGVALSIVAYWAHGGRKRHSHEHNRASRQTDILAMIGTLFLWLFWPTFNSAIAGEMGKERAIVNTVIALLGSCVTTFGMSHFLNGRLEMPDIQNATLAGGVAMGAAAEMAVGPGGAMFIGSCAGAISTCGFTYLTPFLERTVHLHDTCGAHNLHGIPSLIGGLASIFTALAGDNGQYKFSGQPNATSEDVYHALFPKIRDGDRSKEDQALMQLAFMGSTLGISIIGGVLTSVFVTKVVPHTNNMFVDDELFHCEEDHDHAEHDDHKDE
jgi:ammonium transporter Rh